MSDFSSENEQMIERLDRIEARLEAVEHANRKTLVSLLERTVAPHIERLRSSLQADMLDAMDERLAEFEHSIDGKVSTRLSSLEKTLVEQSSVITALSKRAVEAEQNFQRLIEAVERLCAQREATTSGVTPASFEVPFEKQLQDAIKRSPATNHDPGFRPRIVSEEETKSSRHRRPMSRIG